MKELSKKSQGFTLIELMITVAILGIITAIAYPSYQQYVQDSRRADAQAALISFAGAMERFYTVNNSSYVGAADGGDGNAPEVDVFPYSEAPLDGNAKYYDLIVVDEEVSSFVIAANPKGAQATDPCGWLRVTNTGVRTSENAGDCWP